MPGGEWIAGRVSRIEMSGIRRVFDLARELKDPVNLSIGQPHFAVPEPIKRAAADSILNDKNGYTLSQGIPALQARIRQDLQGRVGDNDRGVIVTSGTNGGLLLALFATVNPGDEVILFDPYFVAYPHMVTLAGGVPVTIDTYPDFQIDVDAVRAKITPRTKAVMIATPANPTGVVLPAATLRGLVDVCRERDVMLISDEIYRAFSYDGPCATPAAFGGDVLVVEGFGKTYGFTGWRLGYAHGPRAVIDQMIKLQQFTFICAPSPAQYGGVAAFDTPVDDVIADYGRKRDRLYEALRGLYEVEKPGGAFYLFAEVPTGETGTDFAMRAAKDESLLVIPGATFSGRDSHVRVSYAASDETLDRGIEILRRMAG